MIRLRVTFAKTGALRYIGHLDLQTLWERTARRAGLPLAYTQGFHPSPRLQIASALPLGFSGQAEIVDLWLGEGAVDWNSRVPEIGGRLQTASPPGLAIVSVQAVDEGGPALQTRVRSAEYEVTLLDAPDEAEAARRVAGLLEQESLPRERHGKPYDLRPLIESLELLSAGKDGPPRLTMRLAAREGATGRPEQVLDALGILPEAARVERTRLLLAMDVE